jgi:hypothetical protein
MFSIEQFLNGPLFAHIWVFSSKKKPESKENKFPFSRAKSYGKCTPPY